MQKNTFDTTSLGQGSLESDNKGMLMSMTMLDVDISIHVDSYNSEYFTMMTSLTDRLLAPLCRV